MEVVTAVVGSLARKAAEYTVDPIARQGGFLFNYKSKWEELKTQLTKLEAAREKVEQRVDEANRNGDNIFDFVEAWLTEVNRKISAEQLVEDEMKAKKRCFSGLCPDFKSRYQLSKKASKEANSIAELLEREGRFDRVSYRPAPQGMPIATTTAQGYEEFESRRGAFDGIMEALKDANLSIIGVYGMGGVGKTTLVKQVASQAKVEKLFDTVVMVTVTQTRNIQSVQNEIVEKLGMKIDEKSMDVRAGRLRDRLKKEKNVLIILDDIWKEMDLDALGVPSRDQHMGCKILMTSRESNVLSLMDSQKDIPVDILKEDEAWDLFKKKAGNIVESSQVLPIATKVGKKCAGLPIAIATIGRALKDKNLYHWRKTLRELERPSISNFKGIHSDVYKTIELSYRFLPTEEHQSTFLLCSILGHNAVVEDLLKYCKGLGFIHGVETMDEARTEVLALIDDLKDSSLLLDSSPPGCFDIHDVVRDVGISIASTDHHWLALGGEDMSLEWSNEETMRNCNLISLHHAKVSELPDRTFFPMGMASDKKSSLKIPNNFLKRMQKLKVLYFAKMQFSSLPFAVDFGLLKTLRTLGLPECELKDIAIIGELTNLEILDLGRSVIKKLPKEIGNLTKLKLLDLKHCYLELIPSNVLSRLTRLEELYLYCTFRGWEVVEGGEESPAGSNASLVELQNLSHLTTLEVLVGDVRAVPKDTTFLGKLERFKICIGRYYGDYKLESSSRVLKLWKRGDKMFDDGLLRKVESLHLEEVDDVTNLERICYGEPNVGSFSQLRVLQVWRCKRLKNLFSFSIARELHELEEIMVINCEKITELIAEMKEEEERNNTLVFPRLGRLELEGLPNLKRFWSGNRVEFPTLRELRIKRCRVDVPQYLFKEVAFPLLEVLHIQSMENLERLWPNQLADEDSFSQLTELFLNGCGKLLNVFSLSMSKRLQRLKGLEIENCKSVEEIFEPQPLPSSVVQAEDITTFEFPQLTLLFLHHLSNLKSFYHQMHTINLPSLKTLSVFGCEKVEILFASSFPMTGEKNQQEIQFKLPLFCLGEVALSMLEVLYIRSMENVERIWPNQLADEDSFAQLTELCLNGCGKLLNVFQLSMLKRLQRLKRLEIENCKSVEEIFEPQLLPSSVVQAEDITTFEFPQLTELVLCSLPNLKRFYHQMHTINLPSLKMLMVFGCDKVEILFASSFPKTKTDGNNQQEIQCPLPLFCLRELSFTNLEQLILAWNNGLKEVFRFGHPQQLASNYFPKLKAFKIRSYPKELDIFPSYLPQFLISLPNLQSLEIEDTYFKEIFQSEGDGKKPSSALAMGLSRLTQLRLFSLNELRHLWNEKEGFQNLRDLYVECCPALIDNLIPSSVSFQNLVRLHVLYCNGIIKLVTHSTAKSLVQLQEMKICCCINIEEIIEGSSSGDDEDGEVEDAEIRFPQLKLLEILGLQKLESFCSSGNYTFQFPSLQTVIVEYCQKMKMFSQGESYTPMLHKVITRKSYDSEPERWKGSLNSTIQDMFKEKESMENSETEDEEDDEENYETEDEETNDIKEVPFNLHMPKTEL